MLFNTEGNTVENSVPVMMISTGNIHPLTFASAS